MKCSFTMWLIAFIAMPLLLSCGELKPKPCSVQESDEGALITCPDGSESLVKNGQGEPGPNGKKGDKGDTGAQGQQGSKGDIGAAGPAGGVQYVWDVNGNKLGRFKSASGANSYIVELADGTVAATQAANPLGTYIFSGLSGASCAYILSNCSGACYLFKEYSFAAQTNELIIANGLDIGGTGTNTKLAKVTGYDLSTSNTYLSVWLMGGCFNYQSPPTYTGYATYADYTPLPATFQGPLDVHP